MARFSSVDQRPLPDHAIGRVLLRFGFTASEIEGVEQIPQGIKNVNYRVRAGGADWVLKKYASPDAPAQLEFSHALQRGLAEHNFPLAPLRTAEDGATLVTETTGSYSLHRWVEGRQISIDQRDDVAAANPGMVAELGAALGRLHLLTSSMELPAISYPVDPDVLLQAPRRAWAGDRRRSASRALTELRLRLRRGPSELDRWSLAHLPALREHAERLARTSIADRVDPSDVVVSHNDINWENLVFDDDFRLRAVLDFDNATRVQRDLDVGIAAAVVFGAAEDRLRTFLDAYADAAGRGVDLAVVKVGIQLKCTRSILWSIDAYRSGRVANPDMLTTWIVSLYESLDRLPQERRGATRALAMLAPVLDGAESLGAVLMF